MKEIDSKLPDWISPHASLGPNVEVIGERSDDNWVWFLLPMTCPQIFKSYAIIFHPFWIDWNLEKKVEFGKSISESDIDERNFSRISWRALFKLRGAEFSLENSLFTHESMMREGNTPDYIIYPAEGSCDNEELIFVRDKILKLYGDQTAHYFYIYLNTKRWEKSLMYEGRLSELEQLWNNDALFGNPTAIYPPGKEWCMVSDYDMPCTYIGGSKELIDIITNTNEYEIFKLEPRFTNT